MTKGPRERPLFVERHGLSSPAPPRLPREAVSQVPEGNSSYISHAAPYANLTTEVQEPERGRRGELDCLELCELQLGRDVGPTGGFKAVEPRERNRRDHVALGPAGELLVAWKWVAREFVVVAFQGFWTSR